MPFSIPFQGNQDSYCTFGNWFVMNANGFQLVKIGGIDGALKDGRAAFDR